MEKLAGHIATVKGSKCLLCGQSRDLFIRTIKSENGQEHTDRKVEYFPEDIFLDQEKGRIKIFFIPVIPCNGISTERVAMPLFQCNFSVFQKKEIIEVARNNRLVIREGDFLPLLTSVPLDDRIEHGLYGDSEILIEETTVRKLRKLENKTN